MTDLDVIQDLTSRFALYDIRNSPEIQLRPDCRTCAVLLPLTIKDGEIYVLLIKRSRFLRRHPSSVAFPGGMRDATDTSDIETALRESHEEIGIPPSCVKVLSILTPGLASDTEIVFPVVGLIPNDVKLICNPTEVEYAFYIPLGSFVENGKVEVADVIFEGNDATVPLLHHHHEKGEDTLYGFTCIYCILLARIAYGQNSSADIIKFGMERELQRWASSDEFKMISKI